MLPTVPPFAPPARGVGPLDPSAAIARACVLLVLAALGCRTPEHPRERQESETPSHGPNDAHEDGARVLTIDGEMLRDLRITTRPAESRPAGDTVTVLGELRVNEDAYAELGSPVRARVARVLATPGDLVTAGQALAELESIDLGRVRGELAASKARVELARKTLERKRGLGSIVPLRELQQAEAELAEAEADYRAASTAFGAIGRARGRGGRFVLAAPIGGTLIDRFTLPGRMVDAEDRLFVVADLGRLWLVVHAFERDALRLRLGSTARIRFPALPGQTFEGTVERLGSRVDPVSRAIDVRISIDNPELVLRPGMSATAAIPVGAESERVTAVPIESVQRLADAWVVFVPREQTGVFAIRPIGRGRDLGNEVEVLTGLAPGESVVVEGAFMLKAEADKARSGSDHHEH